MTPRTPISCCDVGVPLLSKNAVRELNEIACLLVYSIVPGAQVPSDFFDIHSLLGVSVQINYFYFRQCVLHASNSISMLLIASKY